MAQAKAATLLFSTIDVWSNVHAYCAPHFKVLWETGSQTLVPFRYLCRTSSAFCTHLHPANLAWNHLCTQHRRSMKHDPDRLQETIRRGQDCISKRQLKTQLDAKENQVWVPDPWSQGLSRGARNPFHKGPALHGESTVIKPPLPHAVAELIRPKDTPRRSRGGKGGQKARSTVYTTPG